jgi:hypothetical protein
MLLDFMQASGGIMLLPALRQKPVLVPGCGSYQM